MSRISSIVFASALVALTALPASAQVATGTPPFGSFGGGPDVINLANLNSHITIPVLHKPGRGTDFTYDLSYDSSVWYPVTSGSSKVWQPAGGWRGATEIATGYVSFDEYSSKCLTDARTWETYYVYDNWAYHDTFGVVHNFPNAILVINDGWGCSGLTDVNSDIAIDGSGYSISVTSPSSATIYSSSGKAILAPISTTSGAASFTDRNGNQITVNGSGQFFDTLSSTTPVLSVSGLGTPSSPTTFTYAAPSGANASYTMKSAAYTVQTNFGCSGISEYPPTSNNLVSEIDLPDGSKYTFTYEQTPGVPANVTGRLASVTLPTGGTISYTYSGGNNGINCSDGSAVALTRKINDGTTSNTWTYARTFGSGSASATLITAPQLPYDSASNQTIAQFQGIYETQRDVYQGSAPTFTLPIAEGTLQTANLLQETQTCYNNSSSPCTTTAVVLPISQVRVLVQLDTSGLQSKNVTFYDTYGLPTEMDDYDYGSGAPGSLLKKTLISYASLGNNINASQQTITVCNGIGTSGSCTGTSGSSTGTVVSQTQYNYDETGVTTSSGTPQHVTVSGSRGNLTTAKFLVQGTIYLSQTYSYWDTGNVNVATDFAGAQTTYTYGACGNSFATQQTTVSGSLSLMNQLAWDCNGGVLTSIKDTNNQSTGYAYDLLWRLTTLTRPDNVQLTYQYPSTSSPTYIITTPVQGTSSAVSTTTVDGLGRPIRKTTSDNSSNVYSKTDVQYDAWGRAYKVSNPYTSSASYWSTTQFDGLGRTTFETQQDGAQTTYSYSGRTTTVTDPAGKQRKYDYDAAGRFFNVWEPDPTNNNLLTVQTSYTYTALDLISTITEAVQSRSYGYDLMGRLTSLTTPESGQTTFQFNSSGLVSRRTDARGVQTNYVYDGLSRLTGTSYTIPQGSTSAAMPNVCDPTGGTNFTANVCFYYDQGGSGAYALGRLTKVVDQSGSEAYTFDQLGRTTQVSKVVGTTTYNIQSQYNLAGEITTGTYPSGRVVQGNYDPIGRLCAIGASGSTCSSGTTFLTSLSYNPAGQLTSATYGNGVVGTFGYSADRLQLTNIAYAKGSATLFGTNYWYKTDSTNCPSGTSGNNGQIQCITDTVDSGRNVSYSYDALYRFISATTNGSSNYPRWGLTWAYDRYGNRLNQTQTYGNPPANSLSFANPGGAQTNRQDNMCFDANGNLLAETAPPCPSPTYVYDGENRLVNYQTASYTYDFAGKRIKKQSGSTTTVYIYTGPKVIAEYDNGAAPASPSREYIYSGRGLLAKIEGGVATYFHNDHLSNRLITDSNGNTAAQEGHYPFGEQWYPVPPASRATKWEFTTYERDSESTNDYALARSFVNRFGRFSSPDPLSGGLDDPQSLNRYAYAHNDPCNRVDPLGLATCTFNINVNNDTLSVKDLFNVLFQIADIFGQGTDRNGNSVAVNFVFGGNADYTLNIKNDTSFFGWPISGSTAGITWFPGISTTSTVFVNNALRGTDLTSSAEDLYLGAIGAHELIEHAILGHPDWKHESDPKNIGAADGASPSPPGPGTNALTPQQIAQMYKDCITKHPPKNASGKGNRRGGGGGGGNGQGSGGQWVLIGPTYCGENGCGGYSWVWWPDSGGVQRMSVN